MGLNAFQGSVPAYVLGSATWTVGEVIGFPVAAALVADLAPPALRGRYQGAFTMSWGIAFTVGPLLGGAILERLGGRALWIGCFAVGVLVAAGHLAAGPARRRRLGAVSARPATGAADG
jgi:MFS family permease